MSYQLKLCTPGLSKKFLYRYFFIELILKNIHGLNLRVFLKEQNTSNNFKKVKQITFNLLI